MMAMMMSQRVLLSNRLQKQLFIIVPPRKIAEERYALLLCYHIMAKEKKCANISSIIGERRIFLLRETALVCNVDKKEGQHAQKSKKV